MKTTSANLFIQLDVECPHCESVFDLLDHQHSFNDECQMINQVCCDGNWTEAHQNFEEELECPYCSETFIVAGVNY